MKYTKIHSYKEEGGQAHALIDAEEKCGFWGSRIKLYTFKIVPKFKHTDGFWIREDGEDFGTPAIETSFSYDLGEQIEMNLKTLRDGGEYRFPQTDEEKSCYSRAHTAFMRKQRHEREYQDWRKNGYRDRTQDTDRDPPENSIFLRKVKTSAGYSYKTTTSTAESLINLCSLGILNAIPTTTMYENFKWMHVYRVFDDPVTEEQRAQSLENIQRAAL